MRRIRKLFVTICVLTLFMTGAVPARGEDTRDPYLPVKVESYTWGDFDEIRIMRTYQLSPVDDPAGIPRTAGQFYRMTICVKSIDVPCFDFSNSPLKALS